MNTIEILTRLKPSVGLIALGAVGGVCAYFFFSDFLALNFRAITPSELGTSLAWLILFALFIERATEVFMGVTQPGDKTSLNQAMDDLAISETKVEQAQVAHKRTPNQQSQNALDVALADLSKVAGSVRVAEQALREERQPVAMVIALILSLFVALVGARVLASFIDPGLVAGCVQVTLNTGAETALATALESVANPEHRTDIEAFLRQADGALKCKLSDSQREWLAAVDVPITAALLSGGANGIHQIVKKFLSFFEGAPQQ